MFSYLCKENEQDCIINFIVQQYDVCNIFPIKLIDEIKYDNIPNPYKSYGVKIVKYDENKYYGKIKNPNNVPFIIEKHTLLKDWNSNYKDFAYTYNLEKNPYKLETKVCIDKRLKEMINISIDNINLNILYFLLYKYYGENNVLKQKILKYLKLEGKEKYIFKGPEELPFIAIPDKTFLDKNESLNEYNFDYNIWYMHKETYDKALDTIYKDNETLQQLIEKNSNIEYNLGKIKKVNENYPHIYRYFTLKQLDQLYIFLHYFKEYIKTNFNLENKIYHYYFHNSGTIEFTTLHLHMRIKQKIKKTRHLSLNYIENLESKISISLDKLYNNLLVNEKYYENKFLFGDSC